MEKGTMAFLAQTLITALLIFFGFLSVSGSNKVKFITITNDCRYPVWAAILSDAGSKLLPTSFTTSGGFPLQPAASNTIPMPGAGSGRLVGRTLCPSSVECNGHNATPPVTLAEFTLNTSDGLDYFKVSLVDDGFSVSIQPRGAGNCRATSCGGSELNKLQKAERCAATPPCSHSLQRVNAPMLMTMPLSIVLPLLMIIASLSAQFSYKRLHGGLVQIESLQQPKEVLREIHVRWEIDDSCCSAIISSDCYEKT